MVTRMRWCGGGTGRIGLLALSPSPLLLLPLLLSSASGAAMASRLGWSGVA